MAGISSPTVISPLVGEMSGRTEGGARRQAGRQHTQPPYPRFALIAAWAAARRAMGTRKGEQET